MKIELCPVGGPNPEDVLAMPDGSILTGLDDGRIVRVDRDFASIETIGETEGRPLGLDLMPDGRVAICDMVRGLLALEPSNGAIEVLADRHNGKRLRFCNNASTADDGSVYFSTSTTRYDMYESNKDVLEQIPTGRLFRWNTEGTVEQLLDGLYFANGVVVSPNQDFVLVAETGMARITRLWLTGPKAGKREFFAERLPGVPDNMSIGTDGKLWIAMVLTMTDSLWKMLALPYFLRWMMVRAPKFMQPGQERVLMAAQMNFDGTMEHVVRIEDSDFHFATGVREVDGNLYFGSIENNAIARVIL